MIIFSLKKSEFSSNHMIVYLSKPLSVRLIGEGLWHPIWTVGAVLIGLRKYTDALVVATNRFILSVSILCLR